MAVNTVPYATIVSTSGSTALCPGESVVLTAENVCPDCTVQWSTGETGPSITVSTEGFYAAILSNVCGESPVSNVLSVTTATLPDLPTISASGPTALCLGESIVLTVENVCSGCTVHWPNGEIGPSITVTTDGIYSATLNNICGESAASNAIPVVVGTAPDAPIISASGSTVLCPGESVVLTINNVCPDCTVTLVNGETTPNITVSIP